MSLPANNWISLASKFSCFFFLAAAVPAEVGAGPLPALQNLRGSKTPVAGMEQPQRRTDELILQALHLAVLRSSVLPPWFGAPNPLFPSTLLRRKSNEALWSSFSTFYSYLDSVPLRPLSFNLQSRRYWSYRLRKISKRSQKCTSKHVSSLTRSKEEIKKQQPQAPYMLEKQKLFHRSNAIPLTCSQCCCGYHCWSLDSKNTSRKDM